MYEEIEEDIESLIERIDDLEKRLAECEGVEEKEGTPVAEFSDVPIGIPLSEWNPRGKAQTKKKGDEVVCYLRGNKGGEAATISKEINLLGINELTFAYSHTYQTKSGQLKVYLDDEAVYDIPMNWGIFTGTIDTSKIEKTAELVFKLISRNPWYAKGNTNLYLYTMSGTSREIGNVSPVFDSFEGKTTATVRKGQEKRGALVAIRMIIRNIGELKGKINVVFSDIGKDKVLARGSCTLDAMETIFPYIYYTEPIVTLSKGGYGGYGYIKGESGIYHLGIKIWGEGEKEPEYGNKDTTQMKTWTVNVR